MVVELLKPGLRRVVIVLGKGGVGKTTVSILLASEFSRLGDTLLVSFDQAKHLVKYLNIEEPGRVYKFGESLHVLQMDLEKTARKIIEEHIDMLKAIMPSLSVLNLEDVVDVMYQSPGFEEEIFLRWLEQSYSAQYRYVVIDTPPTGVALRTLTLPKLYQLWLQRLIDIREKIVARRYVIARALGREATLDDPVLDKLKDLLQRYKKLREKLTSVEETSYVVVTNPEPLPMYEAETVVRFLAKEFSREPTLLVMNKLPLREGVSVDVIREFKSLPGVKIAIRTISPPPSSLADVEKLRERIEVL